MVMNMHSTNMKDISKKSKLLVRFSIEPVDHSRPGEMKSLEVHFLGHIVLTLKEAFRKARSTFSTDDPRTIIFLTDHATCVIKQQVTLDQLLNCCITIDIDGLPHHLKIIEYSWTTFLFKEDERQRSKTDRYMAV